MAQYTITTSVAQEAALQAVVARENVTITAINAGRDARRARGEQDVEANRQLWTADTYVQDLLNGQLNPLVSREHAVVVKDITIALDTATPEKIAAVRGALGLESKD